MDAARIEEMDRSRRRMLWGLTVGFGLWQGLDLAGKLVPAGVPETARIALIVVALAGWAWWCVNLVRMVRLQRQVSASPAAARALDDELTRHARLRAFAIGFWLVLATQVVFVLTPAAAAEAAQATILVGVVGATVAFQRFSRG